MKQKTIDHTLDYYIEIPKNDLIKLFQTEHIKEKEINKQGKPVKGYCFEIANGKSIDFYLETIDNDELLKEDQKDERGIYAGIHTYAQRELKLIPQTKMIVLPVQQKDNYHSIPELTLFAEIFGNNNTQFYLTSTNNNIEELILGKRKDRKKTMIFN